MADILDEPFVSLTTFRRSGEGVATPLWVVRGADDHAVFWTPRKSGKVKRLHNNAAVEMRPCDRRGRVADDAPTLRGTASVVTDDAIMRSTADALRAKYGLQFRAVELVEKIRPGLTDRVVILVSVDR